MADQPQGGRYVIDGHAFNFAKPPTPEQIQTIRERLGTSAAVASPATPQAQPPGMLRQIAGAMVPTGGDIAQLAGEGAMAAAAPFTGGATLPFAVPAGLAARAGLGAIRGGGSGALSEGLQGGANVLGGKVLGAIGRPLAAPLARGVGKVAGKILPEAIGQPIASAMERVAYRAGKPVEQREAEAVTQTLPNFVREQTGGIFERPLSGATSVRVNLRGLLRRTPKEAKDAIGRRVLDETGIDVTRIKSRNLFTLMRNEPDRVMHALNLMGNAVGEDVNAQKQRVLKVFWSSMLDRSVHDAPKGMKFPGAFRGGYLDPEEILGHLQSMEKRIGKAGLLETFGKDHLAAVTEFRQALARASGATQFLDKQGLRGMVAQPDIHKHGLRLMPFLVAAAAGLKLGIPAELKTVLGGAEFGMGATVADALLRARGKEEGGQFVSYLLASPERTRWLTSGVKMMQSGLPETMIIQGLSRSFSQLMTREIAQGIGGPLGMAPSSPFPLQMQTSGAPSGPRFFQPPGLQMPGAGQ
jgi:hypothetical protein